MKSEQKEFLDVLRLPPARLDSQQAAWYLGFGPHDIPILIAAGLLKPLGHPPTNSVKYFAVETLAELRKDTQWLARATDAIVKYWKIKNGRKTRFRNGHASANSTELPMDQLQAR
jgi:hypothetical protein